MLRVVESDKLTGTSAWARCAKLDGVAAGETVRLVVSGHEHAHVYVTLREGVVFNNVLAVSPSVWAMLHELTGSGHIEAEPMRLSLLDRVRRQSTPEWLAAALAVLACVVALGAVFVSWLVIPVAVLACVSAAVALLVAWRTNG